MDSLDIAVENTSALRNAERLKAIRLSGMLSDMHRAELDEITSLISQVLDVPVALVSVVTQDNQVFPSALGLPKPWDERGETPLTHSFCQHVVASELPLQVDDAQSNALVCDNLAIRDLGVQAYLGTPIRDPDGLVLGSLCAIDTQPREWTPKDLKILDSFSATITTKLLARRAVADLEHANRQLIVERVRLNRVTDNASVYIAELSNDLIYTFSNKAYAELFGRTPRDVVGKHPQDIVGAKTFAFAEPHLKEALTGNTVQFDLELPRPNQLARILRVQYAPAMDDDDQVDGLVVAVIDITEQHILTKAAERLETRLNAAHQMSPDGFMVFKSKRDPTGQIVDFEWEYSNNAGAKIAGKPIEELIGKTLLSVLPGNKEEGLFDAYLEVVNTGQPFRQTSHYEHDELSLWISISAIKLADGFAVSFRDVTKQKLAEQHRELLVNELNHRVKNTLATVQAMARQTIRTAKDLTDFEETFSARLMAIATAHNILVNSDNARADLETMVTGQVGPYVDQASQIKVSGGRITLDGECAHCVGLVLHEFATNAAKYGALSTKDGHVEIVCEDIGDGNVKIVWTETGGPQVIAPSRQGFGSRLIKQSIEYSLGGSADVDYRHTGVVATLILPREFDHG